MDKLTYNVEDDVDSKTSPILERIFADYRQLVPFIDNDTYMHPPAKSRTWLPMT